MENKRELNNRLYKTTESILYNFNSLKNSIKVAEDEIEELKLDLEGLKIELKDYERDCNGVGSGTFTGGISNVTEKKILRKEKLKEELIPKKIHEIDKKQLKIDKDKRRIKNIENAIQNLEPRTKGIIKFYYIDKIKVCNICERVFLEEAQIHRIKVRGIKAIRNHIFGFEALEEDDNLISRVRE